MSQTHFPLPVQPHRRERGVALLLTLAFVVLLSFIVLGLLASMRMERETSYAFGEDVQVRWGAELALAEALSCLTSATPPQSVTETWAVAPGVVYRLSNGRIETQWLSNVRNGNDQMVDQGLDANNLNINAWICGSNDVYDFPRQTEPSSYSALTNEGIYLTHPATYITPGWTCIGTNGQAAGAFGTYTNPVTLRYAYWIDAESCKVNVNTAKMRNAYGLLSTSVVEEIDLRGLGGVFSNATDTILSAFILNRPFRTLEMTRLSAGGGVWPAQSLESFRYNQFYTTIYGTDAPRDVFDRERINLPDLAAGMASVASSTAAARFAENTYSAIYPEIGQGGDPRTTFAVKYGAFGVQQILANISDYQRHWTNPPAVSTMDESAVNNDNYGIPSFYAGLKKGPMLDQIWVHVATNPVAAPAPGVVSNVEVSVFVNLKLVNGYDTARGNQYRARIIPQQITVHYEMPAGIPQPAVTSNYVAETTKILTNDINARAYRMLGRSAAELPPEFKVQIGDGVNTPVVRRVEVGLKRVRLMRSDVNNDVVDWMTKSDFDTAFPGRMIFSNNQLVARSSLAAAGAITNGSICLPWVLGKQDPRVRTFPGWKGNPSAFANGAATMNLSFETNWFVYASNQVIAAETSETNDRCSERFTSRIAPEFYGLLANVRAYEVDVARSYPSHRYLDNNIAERAMLSVGELAEIHTGYPWRNLRLLPVSTFTTNTTFALVPGDQNWQATRITGADFLSDGERVGDVNWLSPDKRLVETSAIPDWVMLDMFDVGAGTAVSGRLNINQQFRGAASNLATRTAPIAALVYNAGQEMVRGLGYNMTFRHVSSATTNVPSLDWVSQTIAEHMCLPDSPYAPERTGNRFYRTRGEICEALGIGYVRFGIRQPSHRYRAELINRIGNLITTRSDVFTIYVIAESVEDLDRDGQFDWVYEKRWRWYPSKANPGTAPSNVSQTWWSSNVVNPAISNVLMTSKLVSGDADSDTRLDRIRGRIRLQAVVERYFDGAIPKYRILYTRYLNN